MTTYAFVLGRVFSLSLAELFAVLDFTGLGLKVLAASREVLVVESSQPLDAQAMQARLGGVIKILLVTAIIVHKPAELPSVYLAGYFRPSRLKSYLPRSASGKLQLGISIYLLAENLKLFSEPIRLAMELKRAASGHMGQGLRLVIPEPGALALSSVSVTHNHLLEKGAEIVILAGRQQSFVATTLSVQDFEGYGRRDYGRPVRDELRGMIPPKVAQALINLAAAPPGGVILDPFAGLGTIIQEAMLQGYLGIGTDIDAKAVAGMEKNLEWLRNRQKLSRARYFLAVADASNVASIIPSLLKAAGGKIVSAIVTEGTLGPLYQSLPQPAEVSRNFTEINKLYKECWPGFASCLGAGGRVVVCLPAYKKSRLEYILMPELDFTGNFVYNVKQLFPDNLVRDMAFLQLTNRGTVIYDRKDQVVAREIVVFTKS